jgi:hypothetical protein
MTFWRSPFFQAAIFRQGGRVPARLVFRRELKARPIEFSSVLVEIKTVRRDALRFPALQPFQLKALYQVALKNQL